MKRFRVFIILGVFTFLLTVSSVLLRTNTNRAEGLSSPRADATTVAQQTGDYNYAEVLQKSLYFYEAQQSGKLSPNNRVSWRGDAHLDDGQDVGLDLSGGWYDAGDHWKSNTTMAYAASLLAWSAVQYPAAYLETGQTDELKESLKHVNDYFLKAIVDPNPNQPDQFDGFELYIDIGGNPGPEPGLHSVWCAPEVTNGYTVREALKVTPDVPGPDVAGAMSAAMASSAVVFSEFGGANQRAYARTLYDRAVKLRNFAVAYPFNSKSLVDNKPQAIAPDGQIRQIDYRSEEPRDEILFADVWLHRAARSIGIPGYNGDYLSHARELIQQIESQTPLYEFFGWWRDLFIGQYQHAALMALLQDTEQQSDIAKWEPLLVDHLAKWDELTPTAFGLKARPEYGGNFNLKWTLNQAYLAMMYSDWTTDSANGDRFFNFAKSQMDYALGNNKQGKSFVVGVGDWFNTPHHRGAHGTWVGFDHLNPEKPEYLPEARHVLYGALMGGPDGNDEFKPDVGDYQHNEVALDFNAGMQGVVAGLVARQPRAYAVIPDNQFPPVVRRTDTSDPVTTDQEYFVFARTVRAGRSDLVVEAQLYNKSAWPATVIDNMAFRYFFNLGGGAAPNTVTATVDDSEGAVVGPVTSAGGDSYYVEISFPNQPLLPNYVADQPKPDLYRRKTTLTLNTSRGNFNLDNMPRLARRDQTAQIDPMMPVYKNGTLIGGQEPA